MTGSDSFLPGTLMLSSVINTIIVKLHDTMSDRHGIMNSLLKPWSVYIKPKQEPLGLTNAASAEVSKT